MKVPLQGRNTKRHGPVVSYKAKSARGPGASNSLINIQRTAGNLAVQRLVRKNNRAGPHSPGGSSGVLQRFTVNVRGHHDYLSGEKPPFSIDIASEESLKDELSNYVWGAVSGTGFDTHVVNSIKAGIRSQSTEMKRAYYEFMRGVEASHGSRAGFQIRSPGPAREDDTVFGEVNRITGHPIRKKRDALFAISDVVRRRMKGHAGPLVTLLAGDVGKKLALTNQVRPGSMHEHVKTSTVVDGLISDLVKLQQDKNLSALRAGGMGYSRWDLLRDTISETKNIILRTTTGYTGDPNGLVQDHHSTSIKYIGVELRNGARKQFVGRGSGNGPYHSALDNINRNSNLSPLEMCRRLKNINETWLADENTINVPDGRRAHQYIEIGGEFWLDNRFHQTRINAVLGGRRNKVIRRFTQVENKIEDV